MGKLARRPGPPLGSMNGVKPSNKWRVWLKRRALRPEDAVWLSPMLRHYQDALVSDNPEPTSAQQRLIEIATVSRGAAALLLQAIRDRDTKAGTAELIALTGALTRVLGLERATLNDIGLDRKARRADDVMVMLASNAPEDAQLAPAQLTQ